MASRNEEDARLLYHDPRALLTQYQPTISIIVQKFVASGMIAPDEKADVVQTINERMLRDKLRNMQAQYNYSAYVSTYFSKVVYNLCLEWRRQTKREALFDRSKELQQIEVAHEDQRGWGNAVIAQEVQRFKTILQLFGKAKAKVELCLRLLFRLPFSPEELRGYFTACTAVVIDELLDSFGGDYAHMTDKEVYAQAIQFFNQQEGKTNSPDALRKWIQLKVEEILALLNGGMSRASYDRETLQILLQKYDEAQHPEHNGG